MIAQGGQAVLIINPCAYYKSMDPKAHTFTDPHPTYFLNLLSQLVTTKTTASTQKSLQKTEKLPLRIPFLLQGRR